jgi:uncharacterized LabA/DUF88 family protein
MRVGVYVDGYNLYYAGRGWFGRGTAGWKWLSPRSLAAGLVAERRNWRGARIDRVVYCTARVDSKNTPRAHQDQDIYLQAIRMSGAVDHIELGRYVANHKDVALCAQSPTTGKHELVHPQGRLSVPGLPVKVANDSETGRKIVIASALIREEKGSDVNIATHLLIDVLSGAVDAAVVISNDSDLALPVSKVRELVPVGTVNPSENWTAGALRGKPDDGVGRHWWRQMNGADFTNHQMPDPIDRLHRPQGW